MNKLSQHAAYLAGPIDKCKDGGRRWRYELGEVLRSMDIGVFDPTDKPIDIINEGKSFVQKIQKKKDEGRYDEVVEDMKKVVTADLHMLDLSNFVVVYLPADVKVCGTISEITYAALEKKPTLIVCPQGVNQIPNWIWGLGLDYNEFFSSFEELVKYLQKIHEGKLVPKKWRLIDYHRVF